MNGYAQFYEENLYPLQDGVLRILARAFAPSYEGAPFLTGGTALSRRYFDHRYSDDLDLFFQDYPDYAVSVEIVLRALTSAGMDLEPGSTVRIESFSQVVVVKDAVRLRIDLINDIAPRFGELETWDQYPRVDCLRNVLSNKLTALVRLEPKDIVDLREIALHHPFHWADAMREAEAKEAGIDAPTLAELISTFPHELFDSVMWKSRPNPERFFDDLRTMAGDLLAVGPNSLAASSEPTGT